jgi:hypothetical protein
MPRVLGKALAIGGAALGAIATFLPAYSDFGDGSVTYWTFHRRFDVITLVLLAGVVTLGVISIVRPLRGVNIALAAAGASIAGIFIPYAVEATDGAQAGIFLMGIAGVITCVGAVFVLLTEFAGVPAGTPAPRPAAAPAPAPAAAPPGWFPDPAGGAGQRYWDGVAWTHHVQPAIGA